MKQKFGTYPSCQRRSVAASASHSGKMKGVALRNTTVSDSAALPQLVQLCQRLLCHQHEEGSSKVGKDCQAIQNIQFIVVGEPHGVYEWIP